MNAADMIRDLVERSHFTVAYGHMWTQDDHERLVQTLQACTDESVTPDVLTALGVRGYLVMRRAPHHPIGFELIALELDLDVAKKSLDVEWIDCDEPALPHIVSATLKEQEPAAAIWLLQFGGDQQLDEYLGYG